MPRKAASKAVAKSPAKTKAVASKVKAIAAKKPAAATKQSPTKRVAAVGKGRGGKKSKIVKQDDEEEDNGEPEPSVFQKIIVELKKSAGSKKKVPKLDQLFPYQIAQVLEDYDCMLNQTNIGHNNNKFYVIQIAHSGGIYWTWNRWGRVGEPGQNAIIAFVKKESAIAAFEKKFQEKTKNLWKNRDNFQPVAGKYTLIDMGDDDEEEDVKPKPMAVAPLITGPTKPSQLDAATQKFIELIFDTNMFNDAMKNMDIDTKKMPLGKISKVQIAKGFEALELIQQRLDGNTKVGTFEELSSKFYTVIPHNFGRQRPPAINDLDLLQKKMDMLTVLSDIEVALAMQKTKKEESSPQSLEPHPLDVKYGLLKCGLNLLDKSGTTFKILEKYLRATEGGRKIQILDIWEVNRLSEDQRFSVHKQIENRKLLWHGTNVAVVAAILQSGLRIMPHSGGRVGKGIYFASENAKSAGYVRPAAGGIAIMFLNEVVLGKEHHITIDNSSLKSPPANHNSIIAKGCTEPDPKLDTTINIDGKKVIVPQGKPIHQPEYQNSHFSQSEYLIYREDQCRIRFVLKLKF